MFGLKVWAMSALGLRENSTEHNLLNYQVGPQSGSNAGLGGLSEAYKEPDNTFSMPDPTNSLRVRSTFSMPDDGIRTSSPITQSLYPLTRFVHQVLIRHRHPVVEHVYVYVHMRDSVRLLIWPLTCIWPDISQLNLACFIAACNALQPSSILRCSTSRVASGVQQQSRKSKLIIVYQLS